MTPAADRRSRHPHLRHPHLRHPRTRHPRTGRPRTGRPRTDYRRVRPLRTRQVRIRNCQITDDDVDPGTAGFDHQHRGAHPGGELTEPFPVPAHDLHQDPVRPYPYPLHPAARKVGRDLGRGTRPAVRNTVTILVPDRRADEPDDTGTGQHGPGHGIRVPGEPAHRPGRCRVRAHSTRRGSSDSSSPM
ncbi:hypothetical protein Francci3_3956 [Frankia casuarinae]|uniref:Uncharacterized protein n=1 Tax=Frankia casuarinae (strain DSM 45818 / CECT 9043 / HFP020203 / CcI3) TaxID=106370 RepID=Q2J5Y6_FRACC|nr:hypothetical protein Francci3_3956 [Frankia casuarinae]